MPRGDMEEFSNPRTFFRDWLGNLIAGTKDVLENAGRLRLTERQQRSLEAELALYANLADLVEAGTPPLASFLAPVDHDIIEQLRANIDHWTNRVISEVNDLPINEDRRSEFMDTLKTADTIRAYLSGYPVAQS